VSGPKGVITDLTSINSLLGSILDQVDQIFSKAGDAAGAVGSLVSGSGSGSPAVGSTKRGSGSNSLGLANVPAATGGSGMAGATAMQDATFSETSAVKTEMASQATFSGESASAGSSSGSTNGSSKSGSSMTDWFGGIAAGVGLAGTAASGFSNMMPNVSSVMQQMGTYYSAAMMQGNNASITGMQKTANQNGLGIFGPQGSANVNDIMSMMGFSYGTKQWDQTQNEIANAGRVLNMDAGAAAMAYTGLNTGTTSAQLMRTLGVQTSDAQGNSLTADQIFNQIDQRLLQPGVKYSVQDLQNNWLKMGVPQMLTHAGITDPNQQALYFQHLKDKFSGQPTDMSQKSTGDALTKNATKSGKENPYSPLQTQQDSETKLFQSYQQPYLQGIKDATPLIVDFNKHLSEIFPSLKEFKSMLDSLAGSHGTGGLANLGGNLINGILEILGGSALKGLLSKGGGANPLVPGKMTDGTKPSLPGAGSPKTAPGKPGAPGSAPKPGFLEGVPKGLPGGFFGALLTTTAMTMADQKLTPENHPEMFTKNGNMKIPGKTDKQADAVAKQYAGQPSGGEALWSWLNTPIGGNAQSPKSFASQVVSGVVNSLGSMFGASSGSNSRTLAPSLHLNNTGGSSQTMPSGAPNTSGSARFALIMPVNGPITDGFGPRAAPNAAASTYHLGLDIAGPEGTTIVAAAAGRVKSIGDNGTMGWTVSIDHLNGFVTRYGHEPEGTNIVAVGQMVAQGQPIGRIGMTGNTTGPHVHFQLELNGKPIDPKPYIGAGQIVANAPATPDQSQSAGSAGAQPLPPTMHLNNSAADMSQASIISTIAQAMPTFLNAGGGSASFGAQTSTPGGASASSASSMAGGVGGGSISGGSQSSMSVPGSRYFKAGDDYVAQDSHVNVHTGEAILNAEAADEWRKSKMGGGKKGGGMVNIYLSIQDASDAEARKFATRVKKILEEEHLDYAMGSR
jgi:murein DD-endopeptidase MepM/ murein hydrolase activator NlpD